MEIDPRQVPTDDDGLPARLESRCDPTDRTGKVKRRVKAPRRVPASDLRRGDVIRMGGQHKGVNMWWNETVIRGWKTSEVYFAIETDRAVQIVMPSAPFTLVHRADEDVVHREDEDGEG